MQGLFRGVAGTYRILARVTVIPLVKLLLGKFQQTLSFSHLAGCIALRACLLGGRDRLPGIAHVLYGCASTRTKHQYYDRYGE